MTDAQHLDDTLVELLVSRAVGDLDSAEELRLQGRLHGVPMHVAEGFDRAAAAVHLAFVEADLQPMPSELRSRLEQQAASWRTVAEPRTVSGPRAIEAPESSGTATSPLSSPWLGWLVAAACLLLAVGVWRQRAPTVLDLEREWQSLAALEGTVELPWSPTEDALAEGAAGAVLWNPAEQRGLMRFERLAANDARQNQYQLWIFDAARDERYPVDGGVFDVPAGEQEVIVPIDARLDVAQATLFAITYERAGGVVVSSRERLVLVAPL